ncbi:hypothetical protein GWO09_11460, partial [candidate division KSB1 bacterium]|nr:hypothetical protein [candidate division KSB1 bacterium]
MQKIETTTEDDQVAGDADEIDWFVLKRFYESDNTEDYMQVTVDLSPYVGQSLRFRLRTVERSENAEEASGVKIGEKTKNNENKADSKSSVSGVFNGNNNENASDNARKNANKPGKEAAPENVELIQASAVKGKPDDSPYVMWRVDDFSIGERDTDKDGVGDAFEVRVGTEPNDPESV